MATKNSKKKSTSKSGGRPGAQKLVAHAATTAVADKTIGVSDWIRAARPATLGLAIAPVISGWGVAMMHLTIVDEQLGSIGVQGPAVLALLVAIFLQIGVNFANDYSDGIRGTDARRVGPRRLTASGRVNPTRVRNIAFVFFGLAAFAGVGLTVWTQIWWLPFIGVACVAAAWFYTGGKRPYGYMGLGELSVFIFFGLVEVIGTAYILVQSVWVDPILLGIAHGLFACAVLLVNNIRDRETDIATGKRTLATRVPMWANRVLYGTYMLLPFVILTWFALIIANAWWSYFALFLALPAVLITSTAKSAPEYVLALKLSVWTSLFFAGTIAWALAF
ncbi:MAG: 1,4-dihydroxy-2-naphthoate polyprenyltransferase [Microbacteriaceae bacterium]